MGFDSLKTKEWYSKEFWEHTSWLGKFNGAQRNLSTRAALQQTGEKGSKKNNT